MTELASDPRRGVHPDGPPQPELLVFDVNETLSDMAPLSARFAGVGAPPSWPSCGSPRCFGTASR
jgi:2-haloacid dehalogenase